MYQQQPLGRWLEKPRFFQGRVQRVRRRSRVLDRDCWGLLEDHRPVRQDAAASSRCRNPSAPRARWSDVQCLGQKGAGAACRHITRSLYGPSREPQRCRHWRSRCCWGANAMVFSAAQLGGTGCVVPLRCIRPHRIQGAAKDLPFLLPAGAHNVWTVGGFVMRGRTKIRSRSPILRLSAQKPHIGVVVTMASCDR